MSYKQSYSKTPINFRGDSGFVPSSGGRREPSAFVEVVKEKGLNFGMDVAKYNLDDE